MSEYSEGKAQAEKDNELLIKFAMYILDHGECVDTILCGTVPNHFTQEEYKYLSEWGE